MKEILSFLFGMSLCFNCVLLMIIKFYLKLKKNSKDKLLEVVDRAAAEEFLL